MLRLFLVELRPYCGLHFGFLIMHVHNTLLTFVRKTRKIGYESFNFDDRLVSEGMRETFMGKEFKFLAHFLPFVNAFAKF